MAFYPEYRLLRERMRHESIFSLQEMDQLSLLTDLETTHSTHPFAELQLKKTCYLYNIFWNVVKSDECSLL